MLGSRGPISFPHVKLSPPHGGRWLCSCGGCMWGGGRLRPPLPASPQLLSSSGQSAGAPRSCSPASQAPAPSRMASWPGHPLRASPHCHSGRRVPRGTLSPSSLPPFLPWPRLSSAQNRVPQVSLGLKSRSAISSLPTLLRQAGQHSTHHTGWPWGQACRGQVPGSWVKPQPEGGREKACLSPIIGSLIPQTPHPHCEGAKGLEALL